MAGASGKEIRKWLVAVVALAIASGAKAQNPVLENAELAPTFTVYVYNLAHVSRQSLDVAEAEASRIFLKAGVRTKWIDCPLSSAEKARYPDCRLQPGREDLVLKIFSDLSSRRLGLRAQNLGFCPASEETGPGSETALAYNRIKDLAKSWDADARQVLGFAVAHELGHVLLRMPGHSRTGIMRAAWNPEELRRAARGELVFAPEQCEFLRAEVTARAQISAQSRQGSESLAASVK
ncbi:MAG: hypothetical protein ABSG54_09150 [Terriglobia bacterium]